MGDLFKIFKECREMNLLKRVFKKTNFHFLRDKVPRNVVSPNAKKSTRLEFRNVLEMGKRRTLQSERQRRNREGMRYNSVRFGIGEWVGWVVYGRFTQLFDEDKARHEHEGRRESLTCLLISQQTCTHPLHPKTNPASVTLHADLLRPHPIPILPLSRTLYFLYDLRPTALIL